MLKAGTTTALVICSFIAAPAMAAPMTGVNAQFYPGQYSLVSPAAPASAGLLLGGGAKAVAKISDAALKSMNGGFGHFSFDFSNFSTPNISVGQVSVPSNSQSFSGYSNGRNTGIGTQHVNISVHTRVTGGSNNYVFGGGP